MIRTATGKIYFNAGCGTVWRKQVLYEGRSHSMGSVDVGRPDRFSGNCRDREVLLWVNEGGASSREPERSSR
jgi:hypothetical protein